jgi:hypothetical protein
MKITLFILVFVIGLVLLGSVPGVHSGPLQLLWIVGFVMAAIKSRQRSRERSLP